MSCTLGNGHFAGCKSAVRTFRREVPWLHHWFYVSSLGMEAIDEIDIRSVDCVEQIMKKGNECIFC